MIAGADEGLTERLLKTDDSCAEEDLDESAQTKVLEDEGQDQGAQVFRALLLGPWKCILGGHRRDPFPINL